MTTGGSGAAGGGGGDGGATATAGSGAAAGGSGSGSGAGGAGAGGGAGLTVFTRRGGGSDGAAGFGGSGAFFAGPPFLPPLTTGVSAKMSPVGNWMFRCRARRSTNCRATTSSIVLDALFTSMP